MKNVFVLVFFCVTSCIYSFGQGNVLYGERPDSLNVSAVFFDREGTIYPDYFIADTSLMAANASLKLWFSQHPKAFKFLCERYQCADVIFSDQAMLDLQTEVFSAKIQQINRLKTSTNTLNVAVHGYRKHFISKGKDGTSQRDFQQVEAFLNNYQKEKTPLLRVYWDASYDCCFSTDFKKNKELFKLFEAAYGRANNIGLSLRRLLAPLSYDTLSLLGYSLGAKVMQSCLFNVDGDVAVSGLKQSVNCVLMEPAMGGLDVWNKYYQRSLESLSFSAEKPDNFRLLILYNKRDFVLRKKDNKIGLLGPGVKKYGRTSLGCNYHNEAIKLQELFKETFPFSSLKLVDCSALGKVHSQWVYLRSPMMDDVAVFLGLR